MARPRSTFDPSLKPEDLPMEVLASLWKRTAAAHENLFHTWRAAVNGRLGEDAASRIIQDAWPDRRGKPMDQVFLEDLRVIVEVVRSMPEMLTLGEFDEELLPESLRRTDGDRAAPRLEELSQPALAQLWNLAALAYMMVTERWYGAVKARYGDERAQEIEKEVWLDRGGAEYDLKIGLDALGVEGTDVEALLRGFQFAPGEVGILDVEFELPGPDHGILTHRACPALNRFEESDPERLNHSCEICIAGMPLSGEMLNKDITCRPLKLPPRLHAGDIACQWEYRIARGEESAQPR
jgi:hypothetical protein